MSTSDAFFKRPILNSPYEIPDQHWQLNADGQPTPNVEPGRRRVDFTSAIPKPRRRRSKSKVSEAQSEIGFGESDTAGTRYDTADNIEAVRRLVAQWRLQSDASKWGVTPHTERLLKHWRRADWEGRRPFFCQVEAVETLIWLTEVAPKTNVGKDLLHKLKAASVDANPLLERLGFKLATGAGKTTVMAMIIAWQTVNAVRMPTSTRFTKGFLIVAPGITIKDRLRVLQPNDPEAYYGAYNLLPPDMLGDMGKAKIVITNYHAFMLRETMKLAKGTRQLLQGRRQPIDTTETPGQMLRRVASELMGMRGIMVINDEAHHCYRERPRNEAEGETIDDLKGEEKKEAKAASEEARVWISGLEMAAGTIGVNTVIDLSATPFFLKGSGYVEGTLFPWVVSDFSLMDAIECGIVKLPRVPVSDNIPTEEMPVFRDLWEHIGKKMPKSGRGKTKNLDPQALPQPLKTALDALYGHYKQTFEAWQQKGLKSPPCFIVVCNNTASSKLVYDYISGYETKDEEVVPGALELFHNYDTNSQPYRRPRTLLIDSKQLESGDALDKDFRAAAGTEIELFAREMRERGGQQIDVKDIDEATLLREVMNTVGKPGKLGGSIRCVVSVSMLTEGWDANNVTHIVGVRAFGTQLLCEQVMGRALRRWSYELNEKGLFNVEYADILGIPFDFAAEPVQTSITAPKEKTHVYAMRERKEHQMRFPRVVGYRVERPPRRFDVTFTEEDHMELSPKHVGATRTLNAGVIGEPNNLTLAHTKDTRESTIVLHLTSYLLTKKYVDEDGEPIMSLYGSMKRVVKQWLGECLECIGDTYPAQLLYTAVADHACELINNAIVRSRVEEQGEQIVRAILDPYNPSSNTSFVSFYTTKPYYETDARKCHVNYAVEDSSWEGELCRVLEQHPRVLRYVKNQALGFEVPYMFGGQAHHYVPDFLVDVLDPDAPDTEPLHLVLEVKGFRGEDAVAKSNTMGSQWVPAVNANGAFGRWAFAELREPFGMEADLNAVISTEFERALGMLPQNELV